MGQPDVPRLLGSLTLGQFMGWMAFDAVEPLNAGGRFAASLHRRGIDGDDVDALEAAAAATSG